MNNFVKFKVYCKYRYPNTIKSKLRVRAISLLYKEMLYPMGYHTSNEVQSFVKEISSNVYAESEKIR